MYLRIYLVSENSSTQVESNLFTEIGFFREAWDRISQNPISTLIHVGFSRPSNQDILDLFRRNPNQILFTSAGYYVLKDLLKDLYKQIDFVDGMEIWAVSKNNDSTSILNDVNLHDNQKSDHKQLLAIPDWVIRGNSFNWCRAYFQAYPQMKRLIDSAGIVDDISYQINESKLSEALRIDLGRYRATFALEMRQIKEVKDFCKAIPPWAIKLPITSFDLSVRTLNRFRLINVNFIYDLERYSDDELLKVPGFGRKCLVEIRGHLDAHLNTYITKLDLPSGVQSLDGGSDINEGQEPEISVLNTKSFSALMNSFFQVLHSKESEIIKYRMGYEDEAKTLQEVADIVGLTRERVRQIEAKGIARIKRIFSLSDLIENRLDKARVGLVIPLKFETLQFYDSWFDYDIHKPSIFDYLFNQFGMGGYHIHKYNSQFIIAKGESGFIDEVTSLIKEILKERVNETITKKQIRQKISDLVSINAPEIVDTVFAEATKYAKFIQEGDDEVMVAYGWGLESIVVSLLAKSEKPMHVEEVLAEVKTFDDPGVQQAKIGRVRNICGEHGLIFGRSTYGLRKHLCYSDQEVLDIAEDVEEYILQNGPSRQWHSVSLLESIDNFPDLQIPLNQYTLGICMKLSGKFIDYGRMVFSLATKESNIQKRRIEFSEYVTAILEKSPSPKLAKEIIAEIEQERDLSGKQIHQFGRLVYFGDNYWGLLDKHCGLSEVDFLNLVSDLEGIFESAGRSLRYDELLPYISSNDTYKNYLSNPHLIFNLATKSGKFKRIEDMIYPSAWGNPRRQTTRQIVEGILPTLNPNGKHIRQIATEVSNLAGKEVPREYIYNTLKELGCYYSEEKAAWLLDTDKTEDI